MSSTLNYENPIIKFFIKKKWKLPISGECKLFVEINNSQNLDEFIDLMNEAIGELNFKNNAENNENPTSLMSLLASTSVNDYVNSNIINKIMAKNQGKQNTCYANALAITICLASARVYSRPKLNFFEVKDNIVGKYGKNGADIFEVLKGILSEYRLKYKLLDDEEGARKSIIETRPCLAIFRLSGLQWANFKEFFSANPKGILTKKIINKQNNSNEEDEFHCVVLTHISKNCLKLLNSWGENWGDKGYFRVENADVLNAEFIDIYWELKDLDQNEKENFTKYMQKLKIDINDYIFN